MTGYYLSSVAQRGFSYRRHSNNTGLYNINKPPQTTCVTVNNDKCWLTQYRQSTVICFRGYGQGYTLVPLVVSTCHYSKHATPLSDVFIHVAIKIYRREVINDATNTVKNIWCSCFANDGTRCRCLLKDDIVLLHSNSMVTRAIDNYLNEAEWHSTRETSQIKFIKRRYQTSLKSRF